MEKTHWKKIVSDPTYIGEGDFQENEEKVLTIASVNKAETVVSQEGKSSKAVVHWKENGNKPLILNVTNSKRISKIAGSPYFEDWVGKKVQLYVEKGVKAFGDVVNAVRVRPFAPKVVEVKCDECGKNLVPAFGMDVAQLAEYTKQKYKKTLCAECAKKAAEAAEADKK